MNDLYNKRLIPNSKALRKNMTKEERHLWYDCLKQLNITAHRQKVIGPYIVDFYIASAKLVIEVDGSQHYEESGMATDAVRDEYLKKTWNNCSPILQRRCKLQIRFCLRRYLEPSAAKAFSLRRRWHEVPDEV